LTVKGHERTVAMPRTIPSSLRGRSKSAEPAPLMVQIVSARRLWRWVCLSHAPVDDEVDGAATVDVHKVNRDGFIQQLSALGQVVRMRSAELRKREHNTAQHEDIQARTLGEKGKRTCTPKTSSDG
jgi:CRISPR/Cas system CMR-associated protein Cmr1 (group 7 of RAMP superfamily)